MGSFRDLGWGVVFFMSLSTAFWYVMEKFRSTPRKPHLRPRLKHDRHFHDWYCESGDVMGLGDTPESSYASWLRNYWMIYPKGDPANPPKYCLRISEDFIVEFSAP